MAEQGRESVLHRDESLFWGGTFVTGLLITLAGLAALGATMVAGVVSVLLLGVLLAASGIFELVHAFRVGDSGRRLIFLLGGVLAIATGGLLIARPVQGLVAVSLLLAGYFFASGLFRLITAIADRYPNWGWDLAYGILAIGLGVIIVAGWPISAFWVVGLLVGIELIFRGSFLMAAGITLRRVLRRHPTTV